MTTVFPRRNLGPDADPWGRTIQGAVSGLERDLAQAINSNNATDRMQTTQLNSLVQNQKVIQAQQERLQNGIQVFPWDWWVSGTGAGTPAGNKSDSVSAIAPSWATSAYVTTSVSVYGDVYPGFTTALDKEGGAFTDVYTSLQMKMVCEARGRAVSVTPNFFTDGSGAMAAFTVLEPGEDLIISRSAYWPYLQAGTDMFFRTFVTVFWRAD